MPEQQAPAQLQPNPYLPAGIIPLVMDQFAGVNTAAGRAGVPDEQCYWLDGMMPFAPRNARVMYGVGSTIYNSVTTNSSTIVWYDFINLGATPYMIVFLASGAVVAVNVNTQAVQTILTAGIITAPTILNTGITQWGSQYLIIVADQTNGFWLWDGTLVFKAGTIAPIVGITNVGSGYTSAPTVTAVGGHGSGATFSVTINSTIGIVTGISLTNPGSGYLSGETPSLSFSGGNSAGTGASLVALFSSQTISSISIAAAGSGYSNNPILSITAPNLPSGIQASAFAVISGGSVTAVSVTNPGASYSAATVTLTDTAVTAAAAAALMPFAIQGTDIETYQGRIWVCKQATVYYSAPGFPYFFGTSLGGGNFTSTDSFLKVGFSRLMQSNGFLYLIGDSSVNYISGVQISGTPPTTTFTNQNADPEVGTPYPASAILQGQNILFANSVGIYTINGSRAVKVSDWIDNVYNSVANFGGLQLASATATIFGRKCWMTLVQIIDPISGSTGNKLLIWDGKRWWASGQDITLTYVKHQEINSVVTAYGTNGTIVAPLFSAASTAFQKAIQSKYFDSPGALMLNKPVSRFEGLFNYYSASASTNVTVTADSVALSAAGQQTNSYSVTITGPNSAGYFVAPPAAVGNYGVLNGMTLKTNAADMSLVQAILVAEVQEYRG